MELREQIAVLRTLLQRGRSVPMSASCIINRTEALAALDEIERRLPAELDEAKGVLEHRDAILAEARAEAERVVEQGRRERDELVRNTDLYAEAQAAAAELRSQVEEDAAELRRETDDYVDHKLASFEVALNDSIRTAQQAVAEIRQRSAFDVAPMLGINNDDPTRITREVDRWVETKLNRFEEALHKTLDTVVRGREKLRQRSRLDDVRDDDAHTGAIPRIDVGAEDGPAVGPDAGSDAGSGSPAHSTPRRAG